MVWYIIYHTTIMHERNCLKGRSTRKHPEPAATCRGFGLDFKNGFSIGSIKDVPKDFFLFYGVRLLSIVKVTNF
jgi:hypothetical protein